MRGSFEDLRYGLRVLRGSPGPTAVAILTLALGIAANTTVFGWIDGLISRPFPGVSHGEELAILETVAPDGTFSTTSFRDYKDYRDQLKLNRGLAASLLTAFNTGEDEDQKRVWGEFCSGNYFDVLGVKTIRGRSFSAEESSDRPGSAPVTIIGYRLWESLFQKDPGAVGRILRVNRHNLTIIGIAPPDFHGTVPGLALEMWIPMVMAPELNGQGEWLLTDRGQRQMWITARLAHGVSVGQANQEAAACARRIAESDPESSAGHSASMMPVWKGHVGAQGLLLKPLAILMAVCVVLFLIVVANVASLQLARASVREKEFSIRQSLGASRARLARQLVIESLAMALIACAAGVLAALWLGTALNWLMPPVNLPLSFDFRMNGEILGFTLLLAIVAALLTGLAPAWHGLRANLHDRLKGSAANVTTAGLHRVRNVLVMFEVALALVALVGTGLFAASFREASATDPGFDARHVLMSQIYVQTFCRTPEERTQFCLRLHDRLKAVPGVTEVSYGDFIPLALGTTPWSDFEIPGYVPKVGEDMRIGRNIVAPRFLATLGIPLLEGRDFTEQDDQGTAPVILVNQTFARRYFGSGLAVGHKVRVDGQWATVVGVARDSKYKTFAEAPIPFFYAPFRQRHGGEFWIAFFTRTEGPPDRLIAAVRLETALVDRSAATSEVVRYEEYIGGSLYPQKVAALLLSVLGCIAVLVAAMGVYSVLAFAVARRKREFGIRMALGAQPRTVIGIVLREGLVLSAVGLSAGALAALQAKKLVADLLTNVQGQEPMIFLGAALFLGLVALTASYVPARSATRSNPLSALRED